MIWLTREMFTASTELQQHLWGLVGAKAFGRAKISSEYSGIRIFVPLELFTPDNTFEAVTATSTNVYVFLFPVIVNFHSSIRE